jgi:4-hydroxy-3-methylbut-2-enyl diphosphate reductase
MTSPTICTQRWYERAALRGAVSAPLIRTGRVRPPRMAAAGPLLVAGLAAALTDELRPGNLVVADELRIPGAR